MNLKAIIFVLAAVFTKGFCIQCYECTYASVTTEDGGIQTVDEKCYGPDVLPSHSTDCSKAPKPNSACVTTVIRGTNGTGEVVAISRSCGNVVSGCVNANDQGVSGSVCMYSCEKDNCNTGNKSSRLHYTPTIAVVSLLALLKHVI